MADTDATQTHYETEADETAEPRLYELGFHIAPTVSGDDIAGEVERLKTAITDAGGTVTAEGGPRRIDLAYSIEQRSSHGGEKKVFEQAYFGWLACTLPPEGVAQVSEALAADTTIIRHLLVQTTETEVSHGLEREAARTEQTHSADAETTEEAPQDTDAAIDQAVDELTTSTAQ